MTPPTLSEEERLSIDRFSRDWLAKALQEGSKNVISMLQALQATDPLFKYKIFHDDEKRLTGFMFMSGEGCMLLKRYGHVLFMDFKASGLSSFLWP